MQCPSQPVQQPLHELRLHSGVLIGLLISLAVVWGAALLPRTARAQMGEPPCTGMPPLATLPVDPALPALRVTAGTADVVGPLVNGIQHREMRATWPAIQGPAAARAKCISVAMHGPGREYEGISTIRTLFPSATSFAHSPGGVAGEYCFRFVVLAVDARSEFTERCVDLPERAPIPPTTNQGSVPAPPDAGSGISSGGGGASPALVAAGLAGLLAAAVTFGPAVVRRLLRGRG